MTNKEFKEAARLHQVDFKVNNQEIGVPADRFLVRRLVRNGKEYLIDVPSSLLWKDCKDENGGYRIFYSGFRKEITEAVNATESSSKGQMVTNLLRSEHIPYNLFFPMKQFDREGAVKVFNDILGGDRIKSIGKIEIEYNPGGLNDGTAFDTYVEYVTHDNKKGGIGIEVKYTEKEYPIKRGSKEWNETHDHVTSGIHLAENYREPSFKSRWFKLQFIEDVADLESDAAREHVVANPYRQIWRNHLLGAKMVLDGVLSEFTSLTVYPEGNGHFNDIWEKYERKLTPEGLESFRHITYEELFPLLRRHLLRVPYHNEWVDYLESRYLVK